MIIPPRVKVIQYGKNYYTSIVNNKHFLYSFKNKEIASNCAKFLGEYKHRYNIYPPVDNELFIPTLVEHNKRRSVQEIIDNELHIITEDTNNLLSICGSTNMELLILNNFEYTTKLNNIDVEFSAITIKPENIEFCNQFNIAYLDILYDS